MGSLSFLSVLEQNLKIAGIDKLPIILIINADVTNSQHREIERFYSGDRKKL
jgi:hypothetical protein